MTVTPLGGDALPVVVSTDPPEGLIAVPVVGYTVDTLPADVDVEGGPACPVYVVSAAQVAAGQFVVRGDPAPMRMIAVTDGRPVVGAVAPLPVYVVSGSLDPPDPPSGNTGSPIGLLLALTYAS